MQCNITLSQITFSNGTSCPVTLQIDNNIYNYGECELFGKLCKYKGNEILVKYYGYKNIMGIKILIKNILLKMLT